MAEVLCPKCGKKNSDSMSACQYCQAPLTDPVLRIGQTPTKKDTGELESVLPAWLRDVRQQSRDSADEESPQMPAQPKVEKDESAPDFLAGLASQAGAADDEDIPDWLASINPVAPPKSAAPSKPARESDESDFFAQFRQSETPAASQPTRDVPPSAPVYPAGGQPEASGDDDLSKWFAQTQDQPGESIPSEQLRQDDSAWRSSFDAPPPSQPEPAPKEEEDLSWLHNLEQVSKQTGDLPAPKQSTDWIANLDAPSTPSASSGSQEDLSWLDNLGGLDEPQQPAITPPFVQPTKADEDLSWLNNLGSAPQAQPFDAAPETPPTAGPFVSDEDLGWLSKLGQPEEPSQPVAATPASQELPSWLSNLGQSDEPSQPAAATPASQEDLSWLSNLGAPSEPSQPAATAPASQEDLSWLNNLGAPSEPAQPAAAPAAQEDLSWLSNLGAPSEPAQPAEVAPSKPEEMDWLSNLGAASEPAQPVESAPAAQEDLSWLSNLGAPSEPAQPAEAAPAGQEDLNWLNSLGGQPETQPPFTPPFTEPDAVTQDLFGEGALSGQPQNVDPDWLKSALETPSMPPPGDTSLDWFTSKDQPAEARQVPPVTPPVMPQAAPFEDVFSAPGEPASLSNQDVDSLFSAEMPDWLSRSEPAANESAARESAPLSAEGADPLAPVELPSWVQAMRPVEAVISETAAGTADEPAEKQGPLAGLRGVIPGLPIITARRPKAISLKLQASNEQQASAALLERILGSETNPRALVTSSFLWSQRWLRWSLAALFLLVLGVIVSFGSNMMPISLVALPDELLSASNIVENIPADGRVLVIVDYEPALAGEMEALSGPVLSHMVFLRHPTLSFVSSSSNGPGLVERLMTDTRINKPVSDPEGGLGYVAGQQYFNLGYLPGGSAGILGFVKGPGQVIPIPGVPQSLSEYAAIVLITDHAESGRVWVEQLSVQKLADPLLTNQPLLVIASAQADPLLQPYVSSRQINGIVSGLSDATQYEAVKSVPPRIASSYWDAFGIGLVMAIALIIVGSLWSLFTGIRARRAEAEQG